MLWGYSSALNLVQECEEHGSIEGKKELNVLLLGAADPRHVIQTLAKSYTHDIKVNFYIYELLLEFIARQMLLISAALEPEEKLGLDEKVHLWMEIFGNSLIRPSTAEYVINKSIQLVYMVTDNEFLKQQIPCFDLCLKYKEKDLLENIFKFWSENQFNINKCWDDRLRQSLRTRYDSKEGVFDWDYHMKLKKLTGAEILQSTEYYQFRNNGVAFTALEKEYTVSNPTFALGIYPEGDKLHCHGYCGDMEIGPFFTFGTQCEDTKMLQVFDDKRGVFKKRSTDVTARNLKRIFYEIKNNEKFEEEIDERNLGPVMTAITKLNLNGQNLEINPVKTKENYSHLKTNCKICFLPINALETLHSKFNNFFDLMFVSHGLVSKLNENIFTAMKEDALIICETRHYFYNLTSQGVKEFHQCLKKVMENSEELGGHDSILRFKVKKTDLEKD